MFLFLIGSGWTLACNISNLQHKTFFVIVAKARALVANHFSSKHNVCGYSGSQPEVTAFM
jgi:hypothetical protein